MERRRAVLSVVVTLLLAGLITGIAGGPAAANLPGCSNCIEASDIAAGAVRDSELYNDLNDSINRNDIATGGVGSLEILNGSVLPGDLAFNPATQSELDSVESLVFDTGLLTSLRVQSDATIVGNFGFVKDFQAQYDGTNDRYELVTGQATSLNILGIVVTPMCSEARYWRVETPETSTDVYDTIWVYLFDGTDTAVQCEFGLLAG